MRMLTLTLIAIAFANTIFALPALSATKVTIKGATSVKPIVMEVVQNYVKSHAINIPYIDAGSVEGFQCVVEKTCDIGTATLSLTEEQKAKVNAIQIAWDGVSIVTSNDVKVESLTPEQIKKIFSGEIKNWKEVGGQDLAITVFPREAGRGASSLMEKEFKIKKFVGQPLGQSEAVPNHLKAFHGSISFTSTGLVGTLGKGNMKELAINGVKPTQEAIRAGKYPLRREAFLIVAKDANKETSDLLNYLQEQTPALLGKYGLLAP